MPLANHGYKLQSCELGTQQWTWLATDQTCTA